MTKLEIFDPAMCCSTGVCGSEVDTALLTFSADVDWYRQQGGQLERYNLSQQPMVFAEHPVVSALLQRSGEQSLPLILLNGEIALSGRYPTRPELAQWGCINISGAGKDSDQPPSCCGANGCC